MTTPERGARQAPSERIQRPKPERKDPIRGGWLSLFGPPDTRPSENGAADGGQPDALGDPVARAVGLGYRVVDEYMRQGQNAARMLARRAYGPQAVANDMQEIAARVVQYGAEFMDVWVQLLGQAAVGQPGRRPVPASDAAPRGEELRPRGSTEPSRAAGGARLAVAVDSVKPIRVQLDLEDSSSRSLEVQDLQSTAAADGPPLRGASLVGDPLCLRLHVPPDQPDGIYAGLVLDARTRTVAGAVVVTVGGAESSRDT